jgi:hypothetical protein
LLLGATFRATNSSDLYYDSLVEKALLRVARWTKETPGIDQFFRPIDALLDAFFTSNARIPSAGRDDAERDPRGIPLLRPRKYPLPIVQSGGGKYPKHMTDPVRSRSGTVYIMADKPGIGVKKKRKELRLRAVNRAWYGDPVFPGVETVAADDGSWIRVGFDVTQVMR